MGYHHNPIEPSDWSHGPDDDPGEECKTCEGTGEIVGPDPDNEDMTCPTCDGTGTVPRDFDGDDY